MQEIQITEYKCDVCGKVYLTIAGATRCESKPKSEDKGVKVGDKILITKGEGAGHIATVSSVFVYDREWGHYAWERYWHTVGLSADLDDMWGSRQLTFDDYEIVH